MVLGILALLAVAVLAGFWFGGRPSVPRKPVHYVRDASGNLVPRENTEPMASLEVQAGAIQSENNFTTATTESRSNSRFACRRLAVLNRSDHPLMARVGPLLVERLGKLAYVDTVAYYPAGERPDEGDLAPDLIISLELDALSESRSMLTRDLEATVLVTAGDQAARSSHHYQDGSVPLVQMNLESRLEHRSTTTGVESAAARYKLAAENIAEQIGSQLAKEFDENVQSDGPLPVLPEGFYPAYERPVPLPILDGRKAELVAGFHGLLTPTDVMWKYECQGDPAVELAAMAEQLQKAGWKGEFDPSDASYLRMRRDDGVVEVFPAKPHGVSASKAADAAKPRPVYVHYVRKMDGEKVAAVLKHMVATEDDLQTLLLFRQQWPSEVTEAVFKRLEAQPPSSGDDWLLLAELRHARQQDDAARAALHRAHLLAKLLPDPGPLDVRIKNLQKELGDSPLPDQEAFPDPALLDELGFVEVTADSSIPSPLPISAGRPLLFRGTDAGGAWRLLCLRLKTDPAPPGLQRVEIGPGMRSCTSGSVTQAATLGGRPLSFRLLGDAAQGYQVETTSP